MKRLAIEDGLETLEIEIRGLLPILKDEYLGEVALTNDLTTAVAGNADVMPVPGQAQERTPVDGPEWDPLGGHAKFPIRVVRNAIGVEVGVEPCLVRSRPLRCEARP